MIVSLDLWHQIVRWLTSLQAGVLSPLNILQTWQGWIVDPFRWRWWLLVLQLLLWSVLMAVLVVLLGEAELAFDD